MDAHNGNAYTQYYIKSLKIRLHEQTLGLFEPNSSLYAHMTNGTL